MDKPPKVDPHAGSAPPFARLLGAPYVFSYRCPECMKGIPETAIHRFRQVSCPPRAPGEDIQDWITSVLNPALAAAHYRESPGCEGETVRLVLPVPHREGARVGDVE
ncbi:MAG: hypothetical protein KGL39_09540 [Patescibacteria group bacterium]|nr:hypothetical protein [Patescibacteria group bacterium]